ncbi:GNAT family N-acetyltransferase [Primorskyibacter sp. S87]|uniref:GNAT family N-acetyltransferase n=1 Tax=Primorskyibacter sp. S87 TaxID=3415126 RepID=UPI003C7B2D04
MCQNEDIIYGSDAQIALVRRALALRRFFRDDPQMTFQGRTISWLARGPEEAGIVIDLCRLQGYASAQFVARTDSRSFQNAYEQAGLIPIEWDQFHGRDSAQKASAEFLATYSPPEGLRLCSVTTNTPDDRIHALCQMSSENGVLQPPGSVMRGDGPPGIILYVETDSGDVVATGGGFMAYHPQSDRRDEAFWGMLATAPSWRGHRLARWVGAAAIRELTHRFGARGFSSGVKPDNLASQAMCTRLGVTRSDRVYAGAIDPELTGGGSPTR